MISNLAAAIIGSTQKWERKPADFYPTPPDVTVALVRAIAGKLPAASRVLEPACGDGAMARVLCASGYQVDAHDLREDSGYGRGGVDFLATDLDRPYDAIITNPPFNVAAAFIERSVPNARIVAMLLKSQYWHAARRQALFVKHPPSQILPLTWRPSFLEAERGKSPLMDVLWTVWDRDHVGPTEYFPLARPEMLTLAPVAVSSGYDDLLGGDSIPADLDDLLG